jgi:hypothetical protein
MDYVAKAREASRRWREANGLPPRGDLSSLSSLASPLYKQEGITQEAETLARECSATEAIEETKEKVKREEGNRLHNDSKQGVSATEAGHPATKAWQPTYAHPWPDAIPGLGPRRVGAFDSCVGCGRGSWARYGGSVLCCPCAVAKLTVTEEETPWP